ncbi:MAG TPA: CoA pyrophosphatase [Bauldia sp.]|nr:CoA pyrophosphatase [Bauldia sp.]
MTGAGDFSPERFFARAADRLYPEPPPGSGRLGDHALNPDLRADDIAYRDAAVLIPAIAREPEATILLTQRTPHLRSHAGQIAFPGGKIDAADASAGAAALREAEEEIGLAPDKVRLIGYLEPYLTRTGYRIVPVLGRVDPSFALNLNVHEVEDAFEVPLSYLMTPANHRRGSRLHLGKNRLFYEMPFENRYIWGVTAGILRALYERVFA